MTTRSKLPPPLPREDADPKLNEAAQSLWGAIRKLPWAGRVGVGFPEPCLHMYVKRYSPEQRFYMRNGWRGYTVIVHILLG